MSQSEKVIFKAVTISIPIGSSDGAGGDMRIAKQSHCLRRDAIHL